MSISPKIKALLQLNGKRQLDLADYFGITAQSMNNKLNRDSWSGKDLQKVAEYLDCKLAFVLPDGNLIVLDEERKNPPDAKASEGKGE